jgi:hypothetical protein
VIKIEGSSYRVKQRRQKSLGIDIHGRKSVDIYSGYLWARPGT